jgi:hypothetical protein
MSLRLTTNDENSQQRLGCSFNELRLFFEGALVRSLGNRI